MTAEIGPDATNPDQGGVVTPPESGTGVDSTPGPSPSRMLAPLRACSPGMSRDATINRVGRVVHAAIALRYLRYGTVYALCTNIIEYRTMVPASTTVPTVPTVPTVGTVCNTKHACLWRKYACVMLGGCPKHIRQTQSKTQDFLFMPKKRLGYRTRTRLSTPSC